MSEREDSQTKETVAQLDAVARFWRAPLPDAFRALYIHFPNPFLAPCEFFSLEDIAGGGGREFGMLPQYLPFGRAVGEGGAYGFYVTPETDQGLWPVLYWDQDEMFLRPVASDFEAFLRNCVLVGRYETEEQWPDDMAEAGDDAERRQFAEVLNLPEELVFGPLPRSDHELYERLAHSDPQDAYSLCWLGCARLAKRDDDRALDFFHRASEAAPWFGDCAYLVADVYRERDNLERAVQRWWSVAQKLLPLCTRTQEWNLGENHPEADIYEVAADALCQFGEAADPLLKNDPLWRVVAVKDPYDADVREAFGDALLARRDFPGAEREYLNALSLCYTERGKQPLRLYDALISLYERQGRERDAALARYDKSLPRLSV